MMADDSIIMEGPEAVGPFDGVDMDTLTFKTLTSEQKAHVVEMYKKTGRKPKDREDIERVYKVKAGTLFRWMKKMDQEINPNGSFTMSNGGNGGRPAKLDAEAFESVKEIVDKLTRWGEAPGITRLRNEFIIGEKATLVRAGKAPISSGPITDTSLRRLAKRLKLNLKAAKAPISSVPISKSTLRRIVKRFKLNDTLAARNGTVARKRNMRDPRNFFVSACMHAYWFLQLVVGHLLNMDATQYSVGANGTVSKSFYFSDASDTSELQRNEFRGNTNGTYVKVFNCISDMGFAHKQVYIFACEDMDPEDIEVLRCNGLSFSSDPTAFTYIVFCKTLAGNAKLWEFVVDWICEFSRAVQKATGHNETIVLKMDGEDAQLVNNFTTAAHILKLKECNIMIYKGCASSCQFENELDVGNIHGGSKNPKKHLLDETLLIGNHEIMERVVRVITDSRISGYASANPTYIKHVAHAIVRIAKANESVISKSNILNLYQKAKSAPPNGTLRANWDLLHDKMSLCLTKVSAEEYAAMVHAFADCVALCSKGTLTEAEMTEHNIVCSDSIESTGIDKDARVLSSRRGTMVSEPATLAAFQSYIKERLVTIEEKKEVVTRQNFIAAQIALLGNDENAIETLMETIRVEDSAAKFSNKLLKSCNTHEKTSLVNMEKKMKEELAHLSNNENGEPLEKVLASISKHRKFLAKKVELGHQTIETKFKGYRFTEPKADSVYRNPIVLTDEQEIQFQEAQLKQINLERAFWVKMVEELDIQLPAPAPVPVPVVAHESAVAVARGSAVASANSSSTSASAAKKQVKGNKITSNSPKRKRSDLHKNSYERENNVLKDPPLDVDDEDRSMDFDESIQNI